VYTWGSGDYGQLGLGNFANAQLPTKIPFFATNNIVAQQTTSGNNCMFVITSAGALYGWGSNQYGQLGVEAVLPKGVENPLKIDLPEKVQQVACGDGFTMVLLKNGQVYSCGKANVLGRHTESSKLQMVAELPKIASLACGKEHTVAVATNGKLFTWGNSSFGQLGHGDRLAKEKPTMIPFGWTHKIISISCGDYHTVCVVATSLFSQTSGKLFTWGKGKDGQLGTGNTEDKLSPTEITHPKGKYKILIDQGQYKHISNNLYWISACIYNDLNTLYSLKFCRYLVYKGCLWIKSYNCIKSK
jgi:alpha-tubulin suppressor-like RCC1 family protein